VRGHERVLDRILGLVDGAEHMAAERQHAAVVAVVEHLERGDRAAARLLDQPGVAGQPEQPGGEPW
jgi:hypothetical protein